VKKDVLLRNWNLFGLVKNWRQYLLETSEGNDDFLAWNDQHEQEDPQGIMTL